MKKQDWSKPAQEKFGLEFDDLELLGTTPEQRAIIRKVIDEVMIKKGLGERVTFDSWKVWLMIWPSGLMTPIEKMEVVDG